jgi:hypothetical protein
MNGYPTIGGVIKMYCTMGHRKGHCESHRGYICQTYGTIGSHLGVTVVFGVHLFVIIKSWGLAIMSSYNFRIMSVHLFVTLIINNRCYFQNTTSVRQTSTAAITSA